MMNAYHLICRLSPNLTSPVSLNDLKLRIMEEVAARTVVSTNKNEMYLCCTAVIVTCCTVYVLDAAIWSWLSLTHKRGFNLYVAS